MPVRETFEAYAPAHWACYFINDDCSGMEDAEIAAADDWHTLTFPGAFVVDCSEETVLRHFDGLLTDCCLYTAMR